MKKLLAAMTSTLALTLTLGLGACKGGTDFGTDGKFGQLTTTESVYGFSAASAGMLISAMNDGGTAKTAPAAAMSVRLTADSETETPPADSTQPVPDTSEEIPPADSGNAGLDTSELDRYMGLVESLLSDGGFSIVSQTSDRAEYTEKTVVSYQDMEGNRLQYMMYYNQIQIPGDDDDDDDDWDDWDEEETEENYAIEGIMVIEGQEYAIHGEREIETERDEMQAETKFRVTLGENRYMLVEQELESERDESEQSYSYSVIENNRVVERSTFSYETEDGETELEMACYKDGKTDRFSFKRETEYGRERIRLYVGSGKDRQRYTVRIETDADGNHKYVYEPFSAGR